MCRELGLSRDVTSEVAVVKQDVMSEGYRRGHCRAVELLDRFDDHRERIGFPEPIDVRVLEDDDDGTNDSGYYGSKSRRHGPELETTARKYLQDAGVRSAAVGSGS